jgi:hypothetical protein
MSILRPFKASDMFKFNNMYVLNYLLEESEIDSSLVQQLGCVDRNGESQPVLVGWDRLWYKYGSVNGVVALINNLRFMRLLRSFKLNLTWTTPRFRRNVSWTDKMRKGGKGWLDRSSPLCAFKGKGSLNMKQGSPRSTFRRVARAVVLASTASTLL